MKGSKTTINRAAVFTLCLTSLAGIGGAQVPSASIISSGFVLLTGSPDTAPDAALTKLTAADIQSIIADQAKNNPKALQTLADSAESRQKVLDNLRTSLSLASAARKAGYASKESVKISLNLVRLEMLASAYNDKLKKPGSPDAGPEAPFSNITDEAAEKFLNAPANKARFDKELKEFIAFVEETQKEAGLEPAKTAEQREFIVTQWKKAMYGSARAQELRLETHTMELHYRVQQALILARAYADEVAGKCQPSAAEIADFIKQNPRYDRATYRARAEEILQKVKAGGDFAKLADQYSEDPGNKDPDTGANNGGFYDWHDRSGYVKEFSDAAWALDEGQVSGLVETQFGYHIIKLEGKRTSAADTVGKGKEEVKVRHILIRTELSSEEAGESWLPLEDAAKLYLIDQKQKKALSEIKLQNPIDLPADFSVSMTKTAANKPAAKTTGAVKRPANGKAKRPAAKKKH
jgi:hypothetical protein